MTELRVACRKILSSAQFIDFFVNNMLDLCVLTEKQENFTMSIEDFDLREALDSVHEMFFERITNKQLNFIKNYRCFDNRYPL